MNSVSLFIPCYNESDRLHLLRKGLMDFDEIWPYDFEVIIINDGSQDNTSYLLQSLIRQSWKKAISMRVIDLPTNNGKGFALRLGVMEAILPYVLTLDADMAAKPDQLLAWRSIFENDKFPEDQILIGSRRHADTQLYAKWYRQLLGNAFNLVVRLFLSISILDTQCGFKLYPTHLAKLLFDPLKEIGWSHDIEILLRAKKNGIPVKELPVNWSHVSGEKIKIWRAGMEMLTSIPRIRRSVSNEGPLHLIKPS